MVVTGKAISFLGDRVIVDRSPYPHQSSYSIAKFLLPNVCLGDSIEMKFSIYDQGRHLFWVLRSVGIKDELQWLHEGF